MKKAIGIFLFIFCSATLLAQPAKMKATLTEKSVVKDSAGALYPYSIWARMVSSGDYGVRPLNPADTSSEFLLYKYTPAQKQQLLDQMKPSESYFFRTGQRIANFKTTDINGNPVNLRDLKGKIVVINFWFIDCQPCRKEIPELNQLVAEYKDSSDIVFIAIATDEKSRLLKFLQLSPFDYAIINDGSFITELYGVKSFPTHLILDREGKVYYHSTGYSFASVYWLHKTLAAMLQ